ncbi:iron-sulfur cluster assembly protein [Aestuariivirga sp.]|uniref:iron-sulfur cluster assembly protein n=1 Tax=Aestuariivirga sp. TaxID=2650926 RepID=UPI0039E2EB5A
MEGVPPVELQQREREVRGAIAAVRDPEIDEAVADLDFVVGVKVAAGDVTVSLRLPTFWCPVNFVYLMAEEMRAAVMNLPWVSAFHLNLMDHFASAEINAGVNGSRAFDAAFPRHASGTLDTLRRDFAVKGMLMRQGRLVNALRRQGLQDPTFASATIGELEQIAATHRIEDLFSDYIEKRREAGLPVLAKEPGICDTKGAAVSDLAVHMREIRRVSTNAAANGEMCRMLVAARRQGVVCSGSHALPFSASQSPRRRFDE